MAVSLMNAFSLDDSAVYVLYDIVLPDLHQRAQKRTDELHRNRLLPEVFNSL